MAANSKSLIYFLFFNYRNLNSSFFNDSRSDMILVSSFWSSLFWSVTLLSSYKSILKVTFSLFKPLSSAFENMRSELSSNISLNYFYRAANSNFLDKSFWTLVFMSSYFESCMDFCVSFRISRFFILLLESTFSSLVILDWLIRWVLICVSILLYS